VIRRPAFSIWAIAACAIVAVSTLTSCSTLNSNDTAASVNGAELSQDDLQAMLTSDLGQSLLGAEVVDGGIDGASARSLIEAWIALTALQQAGLTDGVDTAAIETGLAAQFDTAWNDAPQVMKDLAILNVAVGQLIQDGTIEQTAGKTAISEAAVFVDSRYGTWDPVTGAIAVFG